MEKINILRKIENELEPYIGVIPYHEREGNAYYEETLKKIEELKIKKGSSILDVGAGYGVMAMALSKMGFRVSAIDIKNHLEELGAPHFFKKYGVKMGLTDVSKEKFPFPNNSFDCIISLVVIEHLDKSPKKYLKEIYRVLKKGGYFILITPNFASLYNRIINILRSNHPINLEYFFHAEKFEGHLREYIPKEVEQMLLWSGFRPLKIYTMNVANLNYYPLYKKLFRIAVRILQNFFFFDKYHKERIVAISIKNNGKIKNFDTSIEKRKILKHTYHGKENLSPIS